MGLQNQGSIKHARGGARSHFDPLLMSVGGDCFPILEWFTAVWNFNVYTAKSHPTTCSMPIISSGLCVITHSIIANMVGGGIR